MHYHHKMAFSKSERVNNRLIAEAKLSYDASRWPLLSSVNVWEKGKRLKTFPFDPRVNGSLEQALEKARLYTNQLPKT